MKKKTKIGLSFLAALVFIGFVLSSVAVHPALSSTEFCVSCHEMEAPLAEYRASSHYNSRTGVRAECSSCHIPEGLGPTLFAKIDALRHVYGHLRGTLSTIEKYEGARLRMAERVWENMEAHDSRECRSCHVEEAIVFEEFHNHNDAKRMAEGLEDGGTCIDCHKGMVHTMPDLSTGYKKLHEDLVAESTDPDIKADTIYPLETVYGYTSPDGSKEARILMATSLTVLDNDGEWLKVRVDGWQQDEVDAMIYALQGKRIFSVALDKPARGKPVVHSTMLDPDTEQTWHQVSYETWITNESMLQDKQALWDYGKELHSTTCGACHMAIPAEHFLANQWIGVMKDMRRNIRHLSKEQYRFLQKYLQLNAKDVKE
ncbi:MAG: cytochrome C [Gammaproteobacteria bacterium]|nr:cytochrome C [Gammaproteobacteria bacterium]